MILSTWTPDSTAFCDNVTQIATRVGKNHKFHGYINFHLDSKTMTHVLYKLAYSNWKISGFNCQKKVASEMQLLGAQVLTKSKILKRLQAESTYQITNEEIEAAEADETEAERINEELRAENAEQEPES